MTRGLSGSMVPAFVLLALLLGGSSNNLWQSAVLQLVGILLIAWAVALPQPERIGRDGRILLALIVCALVLVLLQLIPLSPALWRGLPGREPVVLGYASLGYPLPWLPLSIAPEKTLQSPHRRGDLFRGLELQDFPCARRGTNRGGVGAVEQM